MSILTLDEPGEESNFESGGFEVSSKILKFTNFLETILFFQDQNYWKTRSCRFYEKTATGR